MARRSVMTANGEFISQILEAVEAQKQINPKSEPILELEDSVKYVQKIMGELEQDGFEYLASEIVTDVKKAILAKWVRERAKLG